MASHLHYLFTFWLLCLSETLKLAESVSVPATNIAQNWTKSERRVLEELGAFDDPSTSLSPFFIDQTETKGSVLRRRKRMDPSTMEQCKFSYILNYTRSILAKLNSEPDELLCSHAHVQLNWGWRNFMERCTSENHGRKLETVAQFVKAKYDVMNKCHKMEKKPFLLLENFTMYNLDMCMCRAPPRSGLSTVLLVVVALITLLVIL